LVEPLNNYAAVYYPQSIFNLGAIVEDLAYVVVGLSLVVCIAGLYKTPFMSAEFIGVPQIAFIGLAMIQQPHPAVAGLGGLAYINGYNPTILSSSANVMPSILNSISFQI